MMKTLLVVSIFTSLEHSLAGEDKYEVKIFNSVTAVRNDGKIPYLVKHPDVNTEQYSAERRLQLCREGFKHVLRYEGGENFILLDVEETGKQDAYVLVNPPAAEEVSDNIVEVRPAYACPTSPRTFIHVNRDQPDTTIFWVIFKKRNPIFTFKQVMSYQLHLATEMREPDAEEMARAPSRYIMNSFYDTDIMTENQCLQMCVRGMNIAPEIGVSLAKDRGTCGTSKYYSLWNPTSDNYAGHTGCSYWEAFSCPTTPVIYIQVQAVSEDYATFWVYVKKTEIKESPTFNIMGYELIIANSITVEGAPARNEFADTHPTKDNAGGLTLLQRKEDETKERPDLASFILVNNTAVSRNEFLSHLNRFKELEREDAAMNTDKMENDERRCLCAKAMFAIFGRSFTFKENTVGQNLYYRYSQTQKNAYLISRGILGFSRVVEAFQCPTAPTVYLHIVESFDSSEYLVEVIIMREDFMRVPLHE